MFYKVNFPPVPPAGIKGIKTTVQGNREAAIFTVSPQEAPNRRQCLWLTHNVGIGDAAPGSDLVETLAGYVTVTPLRADLTAHDLYAGLKDTLDG